MDYLRVLVEIYLKQIGINAEVITKPIEEKLSEGAAYVVCQKVNKPQKKD